MDYSQYSVPAVNILCITISLFLSMGIPAALILFFTEKLEAKISSCLLGMGTFVVFALILESILHNVVIKFMGNAAFVNLSFYAIYGGLAAGSFEEIGRYIVMRLFMTKTLNKKEALMFGIGHGGIESIILIGLTCISNLVISVMINLKMSDLFTKSTPPEMQQQLFDQVSQLWATPPQMFLVMGLERVSAIAFHICASYLVYRSLKDKKFGLCILAVLLHAVMDGVFVTIQRLTGSSAFSEGFVAVFALVFVLVTIALYKREEDETKKDTDVPIIQEA